MDERESAKRDGLVEFKRRGFLLLDAFSSEREAGRASCRRIMRRSADIVETLHDLNRPRKGKIKVFGAMVPPHGKAKSNAHRVGQAVLSAIDHKKCIRFEVWDPCSPWSTESDWAKEVNKKLEH